MVFLLDFDRFSNEMTENVLDKFTQRRSQDICAIQMFEVPLFIWNHNYS